MYVFLSKLLYLRDLEEQIDKEEEGFKVIIYVVIILKAGVRIVSLNYILYFPHLTKNDPFL